VAIGKSKRTFTRVFTRGLDKYSRRWFPYRAASALYASDDEKIGKQEQGSFLPRALIRRYGDQIVPNENSVGKKERKKKKKEEREREREDGQRVAQFDESFCRVASPASITARIIIGNR